MLQVCRTDCSNLANTEIAGSGYIAYLLLRQQPRQHDVEAYIQAVRDKIMIGS
jgi:hypothetical protein